MAVVTGSRPSWSGYSPLGGVRYGSKLSRIFITTLTLMALLSVLFSLTRVADIASLGDISSITSLGDTGNIATTMATDADLDVNQTLIEVDAKLPRFRKFVVLVPVTNASPNLCKFILSAVALGYPTPIIVNWSINFRTITKSNLGRNLSKIPGIVRYLEAVLRKDAHEDERLHDDDIVLVADGYDVWFQLPPDVLLKRYHESNERANERLRRQWKGKGPVPMKQTIVVATQKKCWPPLEMGSNLHCDALPESPMRKDLYGPDTDVMMPESDPHNMRPRFINGGMYLGPAGDLRHMFRRVLFKMERNIGRGVHLISEQGISGEVLGEQEVWRTWMREAQPQGDSEAVALMERDYEYHIGLDYHQGISIATVFEEDDGEIVRLNNASEIQQYSDMLDISPVRLRGVPPDLQQATNPLSLVKKDADWGAMPVYADFFTEAVPAMLHHNAHKNNLKTRRVLWWDRTWYFPYLRQLLAIYLVPRKLAPMATVDTAEGFVSYWPTGAERHSRMPRWIVDNATEPLLRMEWNDICRMGSNKHMWWDEVFRDGKGSLVV